MTKLLVLGLLDGHPMSGYDIQQMVSRADAGRWGGILVGSIYHALRKLEKEKYIELTGVEQTGHRHKAVYQITDQGKKYLQYLIRDSLRATSAVYPAALYSGLSLLEKISPVEARQALTEQKELLAAEYRSLEEGMDRSAAGQDISAISKATMENMAAIVRQQQIFIDKLLELLGERS